MRRVRMLNLIWLGATWLAFRRRARPSAVHTRAQEFPAQTRGRGLRMTERLRDLLRPGWLRVRRGDDSGA